MTEVLGAYIHFLLKYLGACGVSGTGVGTFLIDALGNHCPHLQFCTVKKAVFGGSDRRDDNHYRSRSLPTCAVGSLRCADSSNQNGEVNVRFKAMCELCSLGELFSAHSSHIEINHM